MSSFRFIFLHVIAPDAMRDNGSPFPQKQARGELDEHCTFPLSAASILGHDSQKGVGTRGHMRGLFGEDVPGGYRSAVESLERIFCLLRCPRLSFRWNNQLMDNFWSFLRLSQSSSTSSWNFVSKASLPGAKRCLKRPWGLSHSETGFFLSLGS